MSATATFYIQHQFQGGLEWLPLLKVPEQDWNRLSTAFPCPRKLFLYVVGCFLGCQGAFRHAPDAPESVDLQSQEMGTFYFVLDAGTGPRLLPFRIWQRKASSAGSSSSNTRDSNTSNQANIRDSRCCVVSGTQEELEVAHLLPKALQTDIIEEISDIRSPSAADRLSDGESLRNRLTLFVSVHNKYDRGQVCFLPVSNWSLARDEVESVAPRPILSDAPAPIPSRGSFMVLYVNVEATDPRELAYIPTGQVCRLYEAAAYPPKWLLEIGVARAFIITFGVADSLVSMRKHLEEADDVILSANTSHHQSTSSHTSPITPKSPQQDRPLTRSQSRRGGHAAIEEIDQMFWGLLLRQPRRCGEETAPGDGQEEEEAPSRKVPAWLERLPVKGEDYQPV